MLKTEIRIRKELGFGALNAEAGREHVHLCVGANTISLRPEHFAAIAAGFAEIQAELAKHDVGPTLSQRVLAYAKQEGGGFTTVNVSGHLNDALTHEEIYKILTDAGYKHVRQRYGNLFVWLPPVRTGGAS